jgi:cytochrome b involved in lipid metabolism
MKTTIFLLVLFAGVLGGGYWYSQHTAQQALSNSAAIEAPTVVPSSTSTAAALGTASSTTGSSSNSPSYSRAQLAAHKTAKDCWAAINGNVYNLTSWISQHPGGEARILEICGKDGTKAFTGQHGGDKRAQSVLATFKIGTVES